MQKVVYLAGGCFWGVQGFFDLLNGVISTNVGYANSLIPNPNYQEVCSGKTNASEAVEVIFDNDIIPLSAKEGESILGRFFSIIDPFSINKQGNDIGTQYRSGIYAKDNETLQESQKYIEFISKLCNKKIATEVMLLQNFYKAEDYHQKYLQKNPSGYCHINLNNAKKPLTISLK